jgi:hypothetical protein
MGRTRLQSTPLDACLNLRTPEPMVNPRILLRGVKLCFFPQEQPVLSHYGDEGTDLWDLILSGEETCFLKHISNRRLFCGR